MTTNRPPPAVAFLASPTASRAPAFVVTPAAHGWRH